MSDVLVLCPSRGRPAAAAELRDSFEASRERDSQLLFILDDDDGTAPIYRRLGLECLVVPSGTDGGMTGPLNSGLRLALDQALGPGPAITGFVGDDHRFRSRRWDGHFLDHLASVGGGFVYGSDLFWGNGELPTQVFISTPIVRALGWMALPACKHLYLDNAWKDLAEAADCLYWMPNVVIEHMHPSVGKSQWDDQYRLNNSERRFAEDAVAFEAWRSSPQFEVDVDVVRRHIGVPQPV